MPAAPTLGTLLRHLLELLDGAVEDVYVRSGLTYRPRYTPIMRALLVLGPSSIRAISLHAGITHSAVSQTVVQMENDGLVERRSGEDGRERIVALTPRAQRILPTLEQHWAAINAAACRLERELSMSLSGLLTEAIEALERQPFGRRIEQAVAELDVQSHSQPRKSR
jgi:DNA-binding MarR family transcriptional regulator